MLLVFYTQSITLTEPDGGSLSKVSEAPPIAVLFGVARPVALERAAFPVTQPSGGNQMVCHSQAMSSQTCGEVSPGGPQLETWTVKHSCFNAELTVDKLVSGGNLYPGCRSNW